MSIGGLLTQIEELIATLTGAHPQSPLVVFDAGDAEAQAAFDAMNLDSSSRLETLRTSYVDAFGFDKARGDKAIRGESIRDPRLGMRVEDFAVVLALAKAMSLDPAPVLALWIAEGKFAHNDALHSGKASINVGVISEAEYRDSALRPQIWAYERSIVLYKAFGADQFVAHLAVGDNQPMDFTAPHATKFATTLRTVRTHDVAGIGSWDDALVSRVIRYFRDPGGGLLRSAQVSASGDCALFGGVAEGSIASWLWLQQALFQVYRAEQQDWFAQEYGSPIDLGDQPWVSYAYWNGGQATRKRWFKGASDAQSAIDFRFGSSDTPPAHLPSDQVTKYYTGAATGGGPDTGQSEAALANAVIVKYLCEAVEPWFA